MPRVKSIYVGDGQWVPPTADFATCTHPRPNLRFDPRYGGPVACYCTACGRAYLYPLLHLTPRQLKQVRRRVRHLAKNLGIQEDPMDEHIELTQDPKTLQWRSGPLYANGRKGGGSEETFVNLTYLLSRTKTEHPGVPIRVTHANGESYDVEL